MSTTTDRRTKARAYAGPPTPGWSLRANRVRPTENAGTRYDLRAALARSRATAKQARR